MPKNSDRIMNDAEILKRIYEKNSLTKKEAKEIWESIVNILIDAIKSGKDIKIKGFGKIVIKYVPSRSAINVVKKKKIKICAKNKAVFTPCQYLKDLLSYKIELEGKDYSTRYEIPEARGKVIKHLKKWLEEKEMPAKFDRCVKDVMKQGKSKDSAYAICVAMWKKSHGGRSPFSYEGIDFNNLIEYEEIVKTMDLEAAEKEMMNIDSEIFLSLQSELEEIEDEMKANKKEKTLDSLRSKDGNKK